MKVNYYTTWVNYTQNTSVGRYVTTTEQEKIHKMNHKDRMGKKWNYLRVAGLFRHYYHILYDILYNINMTSIFHS